ncbi:MAG: DEAD/DEAH box helicase [Methanomassiliicoccus sp.]|nr:DEAD/DEAH box helicase [Methanomassiliicoccus sp.]
MKVSELDLPEGVAKVLEEDGIVELYPPQAKAAPLALDGKNLMLAIPTASGKSLIAYLAALKHVLERGGKVLYIVPLRALASEKYDDLKKFEKLGLKVEMSSGDLDSPDPQLDKFDIVVATSEKADSLLRHQGHWLNHISLVVADEVHLLHDPGRGPTLEVTLAKFRKFNPDLQIIALSATIKNSKEVADWLNAEHVASTWRPTPLKEGVLLDGTVHFTDNTRREIPGDKDAIFALIKDSILEGGQCLVFVNTRKSTETLATRYAPRMKEVMAERSLEGEDRIAEDQGEPTTVGKRLQSCVRKGIAFHNAGLSNEQRRFVESNFKKGNIKCIVATPTLAAGINLPARRVIIRDVHRFENGGNVAIPVLEIKQMCGRAGRPRYDPYGEAILLAKDEEERRFLTDNYLLNDSEEIYSKLGSEPVLRSHVLATFATGTASSRDSLMDFMNSTFFAHQTTMAGLEDAADNVLEFLEREGMVRTEGDLIQATFFGRRVSDLYIDPLTAVKLRDALREFKPQSSYFGLLHAVCSSPDMMTMYLRRADYEWVEQVLLLRENDMLLKPPEDLDQYEFYLAELKTACSLDDWVQEMEEDELLKKYGMGPGDLRNKVDVGEWLVYSMRELANIFNKDAYPVLTELMVRIRYGVRHDLLDLVRLRGVGRARARSLHNHGVRNVDQLREVDLIRLARIPKIGDALAKNLKEQVTEGKLARKAEVPGEQAAVEVRKEIKNEGPKDCRQRSLLDF